MKRDMDLVREILRYFEDRDAMGPKDSGEIEIEGHESREIKYHVDLMYEAGLLNGEPIRSDTSDRLVKALPFRLTWQGHEFLDLSRDQTLWARAKKLVWGATSGVAFELLKSELRRLAAEALAAGGAG